MKLKHIFLAIAVFGSLAFFVPQNVRADLISDLQAQVAALIQQIALLQQQLAELQAQDAGSSPWCHTFNTNLRVGDGGAEVIALHEALRRDGITVKTAMTDIFSEQTASDVVQFQEKYHSEVLTPWGLISGTGFVGSSTRTKLNKIYGCNVAQKSITVASPNGGETFEVGKSYFIKWNKQGDIGNVNIYLTNYSCSSEVSVTLAENIKPVTLGDSYLWEMPLDFFEQRINVYCPSYLAELNPTTHYGWASGDKFKIRIMEANSYGASVAPPQDESDDYFYIIKANTAQVKVLSPNGGESYKLGQVIPIKWSSDNIAKVFIQLRNTSIDVTGFAHTITEATDATSGYYNWTIPSDFFTINPFFAEGDNFRIAVFSYSNESGHSVVKDNSDSNFSILKQTTVTCSDSDNGKDYYTKGTTTWGPINGAMQTATDGCDTSGKTLSEMYCSGNYSTVAYYSCPNGCSDGACLTEQQEIFSWNLEEGVNLISFPIEPISKNISDILQPINGKYIWASSFNPLTMGYSYYSPTSSEFSLIEFNKSYFINMKEPATLSIKGKEWGKTAADWISSLSNNINVNWDSLGYPFSVQSLITDFKPNRAYLNLLTYSPTLGKFVTVYHRLSSLPYMKPAAQSAYLSYLSTLFKPGQGYFISFYDCPSTANLCGGVSCVEGYTAKCNADGSNTNYLKGECYCAEKPYSMMKIGNPGLSQFPNNNSADRLARGVRALQLYQGKIYVGTGDLANNRGPINVWAFTPGASPIFTKDYTVNEEEINVFRVYNDILYIPGADPVPPEGKSIGNFYYKKVGIWTKKMTIPTGVHTTDIAVIGDQMIAMTAGGTTLGSECAGNRFLISKDNGESWQNITHPFCDPKYFTYLYRMMPFGSYVFMWATTHDIATEGYLSSYIFRYSTQSQKIEIVDFKNADDSKLIGQPIGVFKNKLLFEWYDLATKESTVGYIDDPLSNNMIKIDVSDLSPYNRRLLVVGDTLYMFTLVEPGNRAIAYSTKDLTAWKEEWNFEFPGRPTAFEYYGSAFYVGLSSEFITDGQTVTWTSNESGSVYRIAR